MVARPLVNVWCVVLARNVKGMETRRKYNAWVSATAGIGLRFKCVALKRGERLASQTHDDIIFKASLTLTTAVSRHSHLETSPACARAWSTVSSNRLLCTLNYGAYFRANFSSSVLHLYRMRRDVSWVSYLSRVFLVKGSAVRLSS